MKLLEDFQFVRIFLVFNPPSFSLPGVKLFVNLFFRNLIFYVGIETKERLITEKWLNEKLESN